MTPTAAANQKRRDSGNVRRRSEIEGRKGIERETGTYTREREREREARGCRVPLCTERGRLRSPGRINIKVEIGDYIQNITINLGEGRRVSICYLLTEREMESLRARRYVSRYHLAQTI